MKKTLLVDIIVPVYDMVDLTEQCISSIRKYTYNYRLIVVDDGSEEKETKKYLAQLNPIHLITHEQNQGYVRSVNDGMRASTAPYVMLLNNDTVVTRNWLALMTETMKAYEKEKCGFVLPNSSYEYSAWMRKLISSLPGTDFRLPTLVGAFTLMDRRVVGEVGFFDERFTAGYGCDEEDYFRRAQLKGWTARFCHKAFMYHRAFSTFKAKFPDKWQDMWEKNRKLLKGKWQ